MRQCAKRFTTRAPPSHTLRRGLDEASARKAAPHLRILTQADAVAIVRADHVLAVDGRDGPDTSRESLIVLCGRCRKDRVQVEPRAHPPGGPTGSRTAVVAPLLVQGKHVGFVVALYENVNRLRPDDVRVVDEAAALLSAQVELSAVAYQAEQLAKAQLLALRARISPHFIYNSLAAIASYIHSNPEEARELLTEFAEFTRYAFRDERTYVTLADELHYVEKYLRLEQARFGERLVVSVQVAPEILQAIVPVLSLQPLVENAVRHGVESLAGSRKIEIIGVDRDLDVEVRVSDDGGGMDDERLAGALSGKGGGIGLRNVDERLRSTFGDNYGLEVASAPRRGTTVTMTVPKFRAGVRAA